MNLKGFFATADNVTATLVAGAVIWASARSVFVRTIGRRLSLRAKLNSLGPFVNEEYVRELFGAPAYGRIDSGKGVLIWDVRSGYLAIKFEKSAAKALEFTLTDWRFRFDVAVFTQQIARGLLGRSTFEQMMAADSGRFWVGARRQSYLEQKYIGNPGNYCTAHLGHNDAGVDLLVYPDFPGGSVAPDIAWPAPPGGDPETAASKEGFLRALRKRSSPNSVATSIHSELDLTLPLIDPDVLRLRSGEHPLRNKRRFRLNWSTPKRGHGGA